MTNLRLPGFAAAASADAAAGFSDAGPLGGSAGRRRVSSVTWVRNWSASCAPASGAASSFAVSRTMRAAWSLAAAITGLPNSKYHDAHGAKETERKPAALALDLKCIIDRTVRSSYIAATYHNARKASCHIPG